LFPNALNLHTFLRARDQVSPTQNKGEIVALFHSLPVFRHKRIRWKLGRLKVKLKLKLKFAGLSEKTG
jgi:hypothetical protein